MSTITVRVTTPDDYPEGRLGQVPKWVAEHVENRIVGKSYAGTVTIQVDDGPEQDPLELLGWTPIAV